MNGITKEEEEEEEQLTRLNYHDIKMLTHENLKRFFDSCFM